MDQLPVDVFVVLFAQPIELQGILRNRPLVHQHDQNAFELSLADKHPQKRLLVVHHLGVDQRTIEALSFLHVLIFLSNIRLERALQGDEV